MPSGKCSFSPRTERKGFCILQLTLPDDIADGVYDISMRRSWMVRKWAVLPGGWRWDRHAYTANRKTLEVHRSNCKWVQKTSGKNRVVYSDVNLSILHGYNGCHYCLPDLSTD